MSNTWYPVCNILPEGVWNTLFNYPAKSFVCESDQCVIRLFGAGLSDPFLTSSTNLNANDQYFSKKLVYSERSIERAPDTGVLTNKDIAYIQEFINERTSAGGIGPARASRGIIFPTLMVKVVWSCILTVISKRNKFSTTENANGGDYLEKNVCYY